MAARNSRPLATNPKLLAVDLLLIENRRPQAMFLSLLLGGLTVALTVGWLDVHAFHADAISSQRTVSAGVDVALGLLLLAIGALVRNRAPARPAQDARPGQGRQPPKPEKKDGWAQRVLAEPRLGLAMLVGALVGLPGTAYLSALHMLVTHQAYKIARPWGTAPLAAGS